MIKCTNSQIRLASGVNFYCYRDSNPFSLYRKKLPSLVQINVMTKIWGFLLDPSFSQLLTSFLTLSSAFVGEPSAKELDKKLVKKQSEKEGFPDKEG